MIERNFWPSACYWIQRYSSLYFELGSRKSDKLEMKKRGKPREPRMGNMKISDIILFGFHGFHGTGDKQSMVFSVVMVMVIVADVL